MHFLQWLLGRKKNKEIQKTLLSLINLGIYNKKQAAEIHKIELEKWVEGEKVCHDPGDEFTVRWVKEHGKDFHDRFIQSRCHVCSNVYKCPHVLSSTCTRHTPELSEETVSVIESLLSLLLVNGVLTKEDEVLKACCAYYGILIDSL